MKTFTDKAAEVFFVAMAAAFIICVICNLTHTTAGILYTAIKYGSYIFMAALCVYHLVLPTTFNK